MAAAMPLMDRAARGALLLQCPQTLADERVSEREEVALDHVRRRVVFLDERIADGAQRSVDGSQLPGTRADGVETVIHSRLEVQQYGFSFELAEYGVITR